MHTLCAAGATVLTLLLVAWFLWITNKTVQSIQFAQSLRFPVCRAAAWRLVRQHIRVLLSSVLLASFCFWTLVSVFQVFS